MYALLNPKDGKEPAYQAVASPEDAPAGAVVVEEVPPGAVWDEPSGALRPKRDGEELEELKAARTEEIAAEAIGALASMFTPGAGKDEAVLLIAGHVLKVCEALNVPPDPRLREVVSAGEKALRLKAEVEGATSAAEVEGVSWAG